MLIAERVDEASLAATAAISVVSVGELHAGIHLARDPRTRAVRRQRLRDIEAVFLPIPVDLAIAEQYGRILAIARRGRRLVRASDILIVATAAATGRWLLTLDIAQRRLAQAAEVAVADG